MQVPLEPQAKEDLGFQEGILALSLLPSLHLHSGTERGPNKGPANIERDNRTKKTQRRWGQSSVPPKNGSKIITKALRRNKQCLYPGALWGEAVA